MVTYFDHEKMQKLMESFYTITGIRINIYDKNFKLICNHSSPMCPFCSKVRSSPELLKQCILSDEAALTTCRNTKAHYIYHCHMGLIEVATPIIYKEEVLGYILFGQITNSEDKSEIFKRMKAVQSALKLEGTDLFENMSQILYLPDQYIASISYIVQMAAEYIVLNKILSYQEDLAQQVSFYVKANLAQQLTVKHICQHFHLCTTALYNLSVQSFGCSIKEYTSICRLNLAKELLAEGKTISAVAEETGFSDANYFVRFFKNKTGNTPKQYQLQTCKK